MSTSLKELISFIKSRKLVANKQTWVKVMTPSRPDSSVTFDYIVEIKGNFFPFASPKSKFYPAQLQVRSLKNNRNVKGLTVEELDCKPIYLDGNGFYGNKGNKEYSPREDCLYIDKALTLKVASECGIKVLTPGTAETKLVAGIVNATLDIRKWAVGHTLYDTVAITKDDIRVHSLVAMQKVTDYE